MPHSPQSTTVQPGASADGVRSEAEPTEPLQFREAAEKRITALVQAHEVLRRTLNHLAQSADLDTFLGYVLKEIARSAGAKAAHLFLHDSAHDTLRQHVVVRDGLVFQGNHPEDPALFRSPFSTRITPAFQYLVEQSRMIWQKAYQPDEMTWPDTIEWHRRMGHTSHSGLALMVGAQPVGHLGLAFTDREVLTEAQEELVYALANQAALAIEMNRLANRARDVAVAREQEKAAQERVAELAKANEAMQEVTDALANARTLDQIVPAVLDIVARTFGVRTAAYFDHRPDLLVRLRYWRLSEGRVLTPTELLALDPVGQHAVPRTLAEGFTVPDHYLGTPVHRRTRAVMLDHRAGTCMPEFDKWTLANGWEMELNVPLVVGEEAAGALVLYRSADQLYTPAEMTLAEALAKQLALAVEMARLAEEARETAVAKEREQAAQERAAELARANEVLRRTAARLVEQPDLGAFLNHVLLEIAEQTQALGVTLFLYDEKTNYVRMQNFVHNGAVLDVTTDERLAIWREPLPMTTQYWDLLTSGPQYLVDHLGPDSPSWPPSIPWHHRMGHRTVLSVPLLLGERPVGFLGLSFREALHPAPEKIELARALAQQVTLALELTRLTAEVREREARLTLAQEAAGVGAWDWDLATGDVLWSPHNFDLWRFPQPVGGSRVLPAKTILTAIHPEDQERVRAELATAVREGQPFRSEFRVGPPEGEVRWLAGLGRHVEPTGATPSSGRMIGVNLDVTERRLAEQAVVVREQAAELARINEVLQRSVEQVAVESDLARLPAHFLRETVRVAEARAGALFTRQTGQSFQTVALVQDGVVVPAEHWRKDPLFQGFAECSDADRSGFFDTLIRGESTLVPWDDPILWPEARAYHQAQGHKLIWHVPLRLREQTVGFLGLATQHETLPDERTQQVVRTLTHQATLALEAARLAEELCEVESRAAVIAERTRIARELHDTLLQGFAGVSWQLEAVSRQLFVAPEEGQRQLKRLLQEIDQRLREARQTISYLRLPTSGDRGLAGALTQLGEHLTLDRSVHFELHTSGAPPILPSTTEASLFHIAREAITNAFTHAQAHQIRVKLHYRKEAVRLCVYDDGRGFDPESSAHTEQGHWGLAGMRERVAQLGGQLLIRSNPGVGTVIEVTVRLSSRHGSKQGGEVHQNSGASGLSSESVEGE